jgi:hypothetical protein
MIKTVLFGLSPATSIFDRIVAFFDRILDLNGVLAARNHEPPYFGL